LGGYDLTLAVPKVLDPEIQVVDNLFVVGDAALQNRCPETGGKLAKGTDNVL